jgi:hypothetical protein
MKRKRNKPILLMSLMSYEEWLNAGRPSVRAIKVGESQRTKVIKSKFKTGSMEDGWQLVAVDGSKVIAVDVLGQIRKALRSQKKQSAKNHRKSKSTKSDFSQAVFTSQPKLKRIKPKLLRSDGAKGSKSQPERAAGKSVVTSNKSDQESTKTSPKNIKRKPTRPGAGRRVFGVRDGPACIDKDHIDPAHRGGFEHK